MVELQNRASGVLMPISSLPSDFGIGTLGRNAYRFVDFLKSAGQTYWQILPICPTGFGDSPYQSVSTFAGNPYFIDLDTVCSEGYLAKEDYQNTFWGESSKRVDYAIVYEKRNKVFEKMFLKFSQNIPCDFNEFNIKNEFWIEDYALFMALKDHYNNLSFTSWQEDLRDRKQDALNEWKEKLSDRILYHKMLQYFFFKQWFSLKDYANKNRIKIIGDLPIYVAFDSADVWSGREQFCLDDTLCPIEVAGCPPDAFSQLGQLWGNPVYDWDYMQKNNYKWWKNRIKKSLEIYDIIRIDHFRGFDEYFCIPYGAEDATKGVWRKGPGMNLFNSIKNELGELPIIAEDLGFLTDSVKKLLKDSTFPGMKVLQFAFDSREESDYLPYKYPKNCVVYTGTHDNDTILGWTKSAKAEDVNFAREFLLAENNEEIPKKMMLCALSSIANTCILTMQDIIGLDSEGRMNTPSTSEKNWCWRAVESDISSSYSNWLYKYAKLYGRI